jgi:hypothetical protein
VRMRCFVCVLQLFITEVGDPYSCVLVGLVVFTQLLVRTQLVKYFAVLELVAKYTHVCTIVMYRCVWLLDFCFYCCGFR